jgi:ribosomal protein S12 methylthiotransferase
MCHTLLTAGHTTTADLTEADAIIVNTCGFIESAKQEAIDTILDAARLKQGEHPPKIIVTGCLAERYKEQIQAEIPEVDATVGIGCNGDIATVVSRALGGEQVEAFGPKTALPLEGKRIVSTPRHYAYLKVAEGCNNRCSYCAIPLIRGPLRSRTLPEVLEEARWLASEGVKELILVAQDITAFGDDRGQNETAALLDALQQVNGIVWIRLLYAYPERVTDDFIAAMARNSKVLPYLDLPIQHINSDILRAMNRKGDRNTVLGAIRRLRAALPGLTLRTTLIAGYPGETQAQFDELCDFVKEMRFDRLGCFAYSQEEDTPAAKLPQLPLELREERAAQIMQLQSRILSEQQAALQGSVQTVLCDGLDDESGLYACRTAADAPEIDTVVYVKSDALPLAEGAFYRVRVDDSDAVDLYAHLETEEVE